jgi:hypothetical protein
MLPFFARLHSKHKDRGMAARFPAGDRDFFLYSSIRPVRLQAEVRAKRGRFEILMTVTVQMVFLDEMLCGLLETCRHIGGTYCPYLQGCFF